MKGSPLLKAATSSPFMTSKSNPTYPKKTKGTDVIPFQKGGCENDPGRWEDLVWYVVHRIRPRLPASVSEDELHSAGMVGLLAASRAYDPSQGASFKTYAYHRIRGAILDELRRMDFLPRSFREKVQKRGEEAPSIVPLPLDQDGQGTLTSESEVENHCEREEMLEILRAAMDQLPDKMRMVMGLYYGKQLKMREIGDRLGLTESRVSQIHANAVARLRHKLGPKSE